METQDNHHKYTGGLLILFTVLVLLAAVFFTIAQVRVTNINEYKSGNSKLKNAKNNLIIAYVLAYIATGFALTLAILYFGHVAWGIKSEIPHLIFFLLLFGLIIVSAIFAFIALSDISNAAPANNQGAPGWIWGGLASLLVAVIVLIISGAWRAQHNASKYGIISSSGQQTLTLQAPPEVNDYSLNPPLVPASIAESNFATQSNYV